MARRLFLGNLAASIVLATTVLASPGAHAALEGPFSFNLEDGGVAVVGMIIANGLNLGTGIANAYYISQDEKATTTAVVSYIGVVMGGVSGGLAFGATDPAIQAFGGITIGVAAVNAVLATWNLSLRGPETERRLALAPSAVVDVHGQSAPGVAFAGRF